MEIGIPLLQVFHLELNNSASAAQKLNCDCVGQQTTTTQKQIKNPIAAVPSTTI